mmetsp:Transcript_43950/g.65187  ORF Transcript_43950/g.65187 Transcript_43950/m.65187 type:complete len:208 (-) Transcript_43950:330-953(-)
MMLNHLWRCGSSRSLQVHVRFERQWKHSSASSSLGTTWGRVASKVKDTEMHKQNQYLEHIRETHDPQLHIKTLEDELKGTIGKALGKQGEKVLYHMKCMAAERGRYEELVCSKSDASSKSKLVDVAKRHNMYREEAIKARWELLVHRQAVGFIVNNHEFVHKKFPIGDALNEEGVEVIQAPDEENQTGKKENPTGQLDWWKRVGRWR